MLYMCDTTRDFFAAAIKENLQTYQRKSKYRRKPVLIKLLTLLIVGPTRWRILLLLLKSSCSHD